MTKFAYPPAVVFSAYIFFLILFVAAAFLYGRYSEKNYRDKEICRLTAEVKSLKAHARDMTNKYADAANEAARLSEQLGRMLVSGR